MNMFATGMGDAAQGVAWMNGIQVGVEQVINPKSAAALRDASVEITALIALMKTVGNIPAGVA